MKELFILLVGITYLSLCYAQNVGIGSMDVSKARLSVAGTANVNSNTVALFGLNGGISLQQAWPTIGLNQYRAQSTGFGTAISTGYGMHMTMNYNNGDFALIRNGYASEGSGFSQHNDILAFIENGYRLRLNTSLEGSSVEIPNKLFAPSWGKMNLVPLGIIKISMVYFQNSGLTVSAGNLAGSLVTSYQGIKNGATFYLYITLNSNAFVNYNGETVVVPGLNFTHSNTANLFSLNTTFLNESPRRLEVKVLLGNESGSFEISGNIMVYGQYL